MCRRCFVESSVRIKFAYRAATSAEDHPPNGLGLMVKLFGGTAPGCRTKSSIDAFPGLSLNIGRPRSEI